jgi:hypothetical protein
VRSRNTHNRSGEKPSLPSFLTPKVTWARRRLQRTNDALLCSIYDVRRHQLHMRYRHVCGPPSLNDWSDNGCFFSQFTNKTSVTTLSHFDSRGVRTIVDDCVAKASPCVIPARCASSPRVCCRARKRGVGERCGNGSPVRPDLPGKTPCPYFAKVGLNPEAAWVGEEVSALLQIATE